MRAIFAALFFVITPISQALAWGQEGHSIVAEVAQRHLDDATLKKLKTLLGGEVSLASFASWADDYRAGHSETGPWHFVDIPYERDAYDPAKECAPDKGSCVVDAIKKFKGVLSDCGKPNSDRVDALRFLVHFVGDIHQPLHAAERDHDQGGNYVYVRFFGQDTNLHKVWDTGLIMHTVYAWGTYVSRLDEKWFSGRDLTGLDGGTPEEWAVEAHKYAHDVAYDLPASHYLEKAYYDKALPVLDHQLAVAGLRLARLLREATSACQ